MIIPGELDQLDEQKRPRIARPGDDKMLPLNLRGVSVPAPSGESAGLSFGGPSIARSTAMRSRGVNLQSSSGRTALAQPDEDMLAALGLHPAQMAVALEDGVAVANDNLASGPRLIPEWKISNAAAEGSP